MLEALIKGITLGLLLSISVGPVIFSIIKQSLNNGHTGGMAFVFGVSASDIALAALSNIFTQLFRNISTHQTTIGIAGSIFLIVMGFYFLFFKKVSVDAMGKQVFTQFRKRDLAKIFLSGFFMNILNLSIQAQRVFCHFIYFRRCVICHLTALVTFTSFSGSSVG